jgi:uncharacterized beta-barrel protein YwiB (DUF1934 family)
MKNVMVRILSEQQYGEDPPEVTELTSMGTMEVLDNGISVSYEESELTGLQGTTTSFFFAKDQIHLKREGALRSEMVFAINREHCSLYDMGMGVLMITVRTMSMIQAMGPEGGFADVTYDLIIEDSNMGQVHYHIDVIPT